MVQDKSRNCGDYGETLHSGQLAVRVTGPSQPMNYLANQWIGIMKDMKRNIRHLSKEQYRFLQKYLQLNAKDVKEETS